MLMVLRFVEPAKFTPQEEFDPTNPVGYIGRGQQQVSAILQQFPNLPQEMARAVQVFDDLDGGDQGEAAIKLPAEFRVQVNSTRVGTFKVEFLDIQFNGLQVGEPVVT